MPSWLGALPRPQVLGVGPPIMSLIDPSNPYTGGVRLRYHDVPANASDPFYCSYDHVNRKPVCVGGLGACCLGCGHLHVLWHPRLFLLPFCSQYNRTVTYELVCNLAKPVSAKQSNIQDCNYCTR